MRIFVKKKVYEFRNFFNPIVILYSRICHDFMHTYKKKYANSIFRISFLHSYQLYTQQHSIYQNSKTFQTLPALVVHSIWPVWAEIKCTLHVALHKWSINHRMRAIITRGLYIFLPSLHRRAVYNAERSIFHAIPSILILFVVLLLFVFFCLKRGENKVQFLNQMSCGL